MSDQPTNQSDASKTLKDLQSEFSTLDRVSHRLALTEAGAALEKVLNLLLPRLLSRIGKNDDAKKESRRGVNKRKLASTSSNTDVEIDGIQEQLDGMYETIHKKLIEMLMHIMKRVREDRQCKLPCKAILELLLPEKEDTVNAFTVNLSLAFLTLGVNRCTRVECCSMLPGLMRFLDSLLVQNIEENGQRDNVYTAGVGFLLDPSRKMRYNQTWHLILRCLEHVSNNPLENAAVRRAAKSESSGSSQSADANSLADTKDLLLSNPVVSAAIFDLFLDVLLYAPVPATSTLIPNGMSTAGYQCLVGGAASENSGCKSWKEEFSTRAKLKELKLKFLDLVAPCRRFAIFLPDKSTNQATGVDDCAVKSMDATHNLKGLGMSRTVALMVLLSGDADLDVKSKAESYLRAHMDTYRGKETPADGSTEDSFNKINDPLLGNQVVLANSLLAYVAGGVSSNAIVEKVLSDFKSQTASIVATSRLGLVYHKSDNNDAQQKAALSCCRMKISDTTTASGLKFVAKMLEDNPKFLMGGLDMENDEADIAAVSIGSLVVNIFADLWKPGSSGSSAVEAAASVLNALCLRLAFFYESRQQFDSEQAGSSGRLQALLARSLALACAVLAPTSSGESTTLSNNGTRTASIQVEIRDKMYGVMCTLARSQRFSLDESYALMNCGNSDGTSSLTSTSTASLLFGCAANEIEMLRPRASSALDALLSAYVRVVTPLLEKNKSAELEVKKEPTNPWATALPSKPTDVVKKNEIKKPSNTDGLSRSLLPLLWNAARRCQPKSSRLSGARWSHELLLQMNAINTIHLLCFLSGDDDATVSSIAKKALGIDDAIGEDVSLSSLESTNDEESKFSELVVAIMSDESISSRPTYKGFHARSQAASLRFLLQLLLSEGSYYDDDKLREYVFTILTTLATYKSRSLTRDEADLLDECSICLAGCTSSSQEARSAVISESNGFGLEDIADQAITSSSSKARRHFAEVMRNLYEDQSLWDDTFDPSTGTFSTSSWIDVTGLLRRATVCREKLGTMIHSSHVLGEVHGAAYLGSSCVHAFRLEMSKKSTNAETDPRISQCWEICSNIVALLGKGISHAELAIGNACSQGLIIAFGYSGQEAPVLDSHLYGSMAVVLDEINCSLKKFSSIDHADPTRASSLVRAAGVLLAASTTGAGAISKTGLASSVDLGPSRLQCIESLFAVVGSAVHRKDEELSLDVGEALVQYADAIGFGEWSSTSDLVWESGSYDESFAFSLPPHKHVLYTIFKREIVSNNPVKKAGCSALLLAIVGQASRLSIMDELLASRTMIKEVFKHLEKFQLAFIELLSDPKSKQLARECCCKGLAACRGLSLACGRTEGSSNALSDTLNERLIKAFGQTSNFGGSAMMETAVQARERRNQGEEASAVDVQQTEVGGVAGMGEAELGAYREMANASMALDRPDIMYTLMILATNHPVWLSSDVRDRYNSRSLLGSAQGLNDGEIRIALKPHMGKLIPSLLRACNDPNKQTREQMNALWIALSGGGSEARDLITQHYLLTLDVLTEDAMSKLWRARAGACGALADLIVGRSWDELGGGGVDEDEGDALTRGAAIRLLRLWKCTMRALDDIRAPVRERGETLGRAVRALTIRLCDPLATNVTAEEGAYMSNAERERYKKQNEVNAEKAATVSLVWLVKVGLNQPCAEATGISISCLLGIVDVAKPSTLQPVLDSLVGTLLMAMSGLEPAALNYLQVRAAGNDVGHGNGNDSYDRLEAARVRLAQSGPIYEALNKCIAMIRHIDLDAQKKLVPELDSALRRGAGFATRAATADAVASLCNACPNAFKFPGISTTNPTVRLLRALYFASERERGASSKDKMTHALGSLAELAPGKAVRALAARACERYSESSGSNSDPSVRKAAASTIRAIVVRATSHLQDGDVWVKIVLPTSFLGRHDNDPKVASLWNDVWEEGGSAIGNREDTFGTTPQEKLLPHLTKVIIQNLQCNSWSNRTAACAVLTELADASILAPLPFSVDECSVPEGSKERFGMRAVASRYCLAECVKIIQRRRIWLGKGEVVKAAALVGGKWASVAPLNGSTSLGMSMDCFPLVICSDCPDDLFEGDLWFKASDNEANGVDEQEVTSSDEKYNSDENNLSENETTLDFTEEPNMDDEEPTIDNNTDTVQVVKPLTFSGFCRLLCDQGLRVSGNVSTEGVLPYKSAALAGMSSFLRTIVATKKSSSYEEVVSHQRLVYNMLAPQLFSFISSSQEADKTMPPLLVAKALECLASAFYDDVGDELCPEYANSLIMIKFLTECSGVKQPAWTIRQSAVLAASSLASKMSLKRLSKNEVITTILECSSHALKDRKFWKVRQAGLELLLSLVNRVGDLKVSTPDPDNQLLMESILPYKEKIIGLARQSFSDNESQVTAVASKVKMVMSWWP